MHHPHDHQDGGFAQDMAQLLSRRRLLSLGAAGLALAGCDQWPFAEAAERNATATAADGARCIKLPQETLGPFPAEGTNSREGAVVNVLDKQGIIRADMRPNLDGSDVADGVPFTLEVRLVDVGQACTPLAGHLVYFWQCDAAGSYSLYERPQSSNLRGAALTDASGLARITSIVPGCYRGRWPHIHFEVFASAEAAGSGGESLLVSQFALEKALCDAAYAAHPAYVDSIANLAVLSLERDGIFANNTPEQLAAQTLKASGDPSQGFVARTDVGLVRQA
jgi:protocatechuate 3,4-dioxygenase beta subunit